MFTEKGIRKQKDNHAFRQRTVISEFSLADRSCRSLLTEDMYGEGFLRNDGFTYVPVEM